MKRLPGSVKTIKTIVITNIPFLIIQLISIASMAALPMAIGCIIGGIIMERYGRKMAHLILNIPFIVGWIIIAVATNITWILVGRFLTGFCVGLLGPPASVYIGETSGPKYRGFLLAGVSLAIAIGILLSHLLGTFLSWRLTAIICAVCPLISFLCMLLAPESPSWLLSKRKVENALKSFKWLRGMDDESLQEFENMVANQNTSTVSNYSWAILKDNIRQPTFIKPLFILLGFFLTMQFAGVNAVSFYSVTIMKETIGDGLNEYVAMLVIDVVRFFMSLLACILLRKCGRRPLLMVSGVGTVVSLISLAVFLYFSSRNEALKSIAWLPMTCLIAYICFVSVGIVPLPWCMTGELFPLALRGLGSGLSSSFNFICFFAVVKTGPTFFRTIGQEGAFFIYGSVALIGTIFLVLCLPETKDKTLQEIENSFRSSKKLDNERSGKV